jgi:hypothetical protein
MVPSDKKNFPLFIQNNPKISCVRLGEVHCVCLFLQQKKKGTERRKERNKKNKKKKERNTATLGDRLHKDKNTVWQ